MKVCFFSSDISRTGGTERVSLIIANELVKRGYEVCFLSLFRGDTTKFTRHDSIKLFSLHMENKTGFVERKIFPYVRLLRFLKKENPDVLINIDVILCLYSLPLRFFVKTKMIAWEHFNFRTNCGVKNRDRARKLAAKLADQIVVLTKADLEEYNKNLTIEHNIEHIYNPIVEVEKNISYANKENIVIASGRLAPPKNFLELLKIWALIEPDFPEWKLFICGSGEEENELKDFAKKNKLCNVTFAGFVENIEELYNKSKIMVMTSRYEGFPMVLLEGQTAGLPIVSYDCFTGPKEIVISGRNGYLVQQGDRDVFSEKLKGLMNNEDARKTFSMNAFKDSNRFKKDKIVDKWEGLINGLFEK